MRIHTRWLAAAGLVLGLSLALTFLLEPVDLPAGLHGPDGRNYLSQLHSLWFDRDVLLFDDQALLGLRTLVTPTGYALELHNIGTALAFLPFYALGVGTCLLTGGECAGDALAVNVWLSLGNWAFGLLALVLTWRLAARHAARRWATLAVGAVALGSSFFAYWTRFFNPHMPALALVAALALIWDGSRDGRRLHHWAWMGVLAGLAACIASYNLVFLLLPIADLVGHAGRRRRVPWAEAACLAAGTAAGLLPQLVVWRLMFGSFLGTPYGRQLFWLQPGLPDLLTSSYHGLYFFAPVLALATAGFWPLFRYDRRLALTALLAFAAHVYVSSCNIAWWGGASFGARYLLSSLPLLALPLAVLLERARPRALLGVALLACLAWTYAFFLADFGRTIDSGQYIPAAWQMRVLGQVVAGLPDLLRHHLLAPRFAAAPWVALPAASLLCGLAWLAARMRLPGPRATACLVLLPALAAGLLALSDRPSQREIARLRAQGNLDAFPSGSFDRYDLSEGYWQRGAYRFVRGDGERARADFETAQQIDPSRGWVRLHVAGLAHVPNRQDRLAAPGLALAGLEAGPDAVTLYWQTDAPFLSPTVRTELALYDASGGLLSSITPAQPDAWRALAGELVRVAYPLPRPAVARPQVLALTVYPAGGGEPWGRLEVPLDGP